MGTSSFEHHRANPFARIRLRHGEHAIDPEAYKRNGLTRMPFRRQQLQRQFVRVWPFVLLPLSSRRARSFGMGIDVRSWEKNTNVINTRAAVAIAQPISLTRRATIQ
jgi:hypothetical protein